MNVGHCCQEKKSQENGDLEYITVIAEGPVCLEVFFLHLPVASLRSRDLLLVLFLYVYVLQAEASGPTQL